MATVETNGTPISVGGMDGFGGGMGIWGFLILAMFMMGSGGFGWGNNGFANAIGYENLATSNEVQRGFDNQNTMANQREILAAVNDASARGIAATQQTFHDTLQALDDKYNELQRDNAELRVGQANLLAKQNECCCSTLRAIDSVNYNGALNTAAIKENATAIGQKILDKLAENKQEAMQNRINQLELNQAMAGVVRYPSATTYTAGANPFFYGNGGWVYPNV
jgi:hypothetical protein